jgi:hypothetical protein
VYQTKNSYRRDEIIVELFWEQQNQTQQDTGKGAAYPASSKKLDFHTILREV